MAEIVRSLEELYTALCLPFSADVVELKPGAVAEEKKRVLALAYVDARHYQARLDAVVGPDGWMVHYKPWGERAVICALTVLGVTREDVGEAEKNDPNQATSAAMQAFKRACAAFGVGRYLYTDLPTAWVEAEQRGRSWQIVNAPQVVQQLYQQAGLDGARRGQYLQRIRGLLQQLSEEELVRAGKYLAGIVRETTP